eukprot:10119440-Alexandrium_andersonii.AAC.1
MHDWLRRHGDPDVARFIMAMHSRSRVRMKCRDGEAEGLLRQGIRTGDRPGPRIFIGVYDEQLAQWRRDVGGGIPVQWDGREFDATYTVYADDLAQLDQLDAGTVQRNVE